LINGDLYILVANGTDCLSVNPVLVLDL